jgi:hypothetical protein
MYVQNVIRLVQKPLGWLVTQEVKILRPANIVGVNILQTGFMTEKNP